MIYDELLENIRYTAYSVHNGHAIPLDRIVNQLHALHKVVELHKEDYGFCMICPDFDYPCETIKAIERELN